MSERFQSLKSLGCFVAGFACTPGGVVALVGCVLLALKFFDLIGF